MQQNNEIIIKPPDKGSTIVILDEAAYINEEQKQLNINHFFQSRDTDLTGEVIHRATFMYTICLQKGQISQCTCSYLTTDIDRTQQFYMLPQI